MKKILFFVLLLTVTTSIIKAQELNAIPVSQEIKQFSNGWYKFQIEDVIFDVEISEGYLVKGNLVWLDGSKYSGSLSNTNISGKGTYTWPDGSRYEGSFKQNQRHGKGSMISIDGTKWSGKWKLNKKNGKGKMFDADGNVTEKGTWKDNVIVLN